MGKYKTSIINRLKEVSPVRLIVSSFFIVIAVGTLLLCLPIASKDGSSTYWVDSLFVSTSATCVTGLTVFDTYTHWSLFGQIVVILLIQIGGLGVVSFATGFILFLRRKLDLRDLQIATEYTNGTIMNISKLIKTILIWTFTCEFIGVLLLSIRFIPQFGLHGLWIAVFTSISAYCNAGFDIMGFIQYGCSLIPYFNDPLVTLTISFLIIIGGIGFIVVSDIYSYLSIKLKNKSSHPRLSTHSSVVIITTIALLIIGTALFLFFEYDNTLKGMSLTDKLNASFFQAASPRTAGFFSVPIGQELDRTKILTIILMFIGASPSSTGGGIKTTTFIVLLATVISVLRNHDDTILMKHKINKSTVYKSLSIFTLSLIFVFSASALVSFIESSNGVTTIDAVFEVVSAFGTVGLTAGITEKIHDASKLILSFVMFLGRVGPLALILSLTITNMKRSEKVLPEGRIIVG